MPALFVYSAPSLIAHDYKHVPPPGRISALQLDRPFTIVYSATTQGYYNGPTPTTNLRVTLSYDGVNLLFQSENVSSHAIRTVLYNGHETYTMDSDSRIAEIDPGFDFARMIYCPFPGVGIPKVPLFTDGILPKFMPAVMKAIGPAQSSESKYVDRVLTNTPGQARDYGGFQYWDEEANPTNHHTGLGSVVSTLSTGMPKALWYDTFDNVGPNLGTVWQFYDHQRFENVWLATRIKMQAYVTIKATGANVVFQQARYRLSSASDQPLSTTAYNPTTYLQAQANITDTTGHTIRSFVYQKTGGSLQEQRAAEIDVAKALAASAPSHANTGLIGLVITLLFSAIWFMWKVRRQRRNDQ
jgi:hypothetical protein